MSRNQGDVQSVQRFVPTEDDHFVDEYITRRHGAKRSVEYTNRRDVLAAYAAKLRGNYDERADEEEEIEYIEEEEDEFAEEEFEYVDEHGNLLIHAEAEEKEGELVEEEEIEYIEGEEEEIEDIEGEEEEIEYEEEAISRNLKGMRRKPTTTWYLDDDGTLY